jgi:ABC-2 type transport system permease protein
MRIIFHIVLHDVRVFLKNPGTLISMVVLPLVMAFALGLGIGALNNAPDRIRIDVIDHDRSDLSAAFLNDLRAANTTLRLCPFDDAEDNYCELGEDANLTPERALERLGNNTSLALIEIPAGFQEKLQAGEPVTIVYRSNESAVAPSYILQAVQAVVQRMGGALVAAQVGVNIADETLELDGDAERSAFRQGVYDRAAGLWAANPVSVDYQLTDVQRASSTQSGFGQSVPGMATMFAMFMVFTGMGNLMVERKNWTLQRLVTLPITRGQILAGKILMYFSLGMLEFLIVFALGILLGVNFGRDPLALVLTMVAFALCSAALTFAISTLLRSEMQGWAMVNLLGLTLAPLGGAWWPLDVVPDFMRTVGHLSPVAWAMDSFQLLIFENAVLADIVGNLAILLAAAAVLFAFAIWRFKYE